MKPASDFGASGVGSSIVTAGGGAPENTGRIVPGKNYRAPGVTVIVCGGRDFTDQERAFMVLDRAHAKRRIDLVIQGGAPGADRLAKLWAEARGIECREVPAKWDEEGPAAGPKRNQRMADMKPDGVIALPGGRGTADMVRRALAAGIAVWEPFG